MAKKLLGSFDQEILKWFLLKEKKKKRKISRSRRVSASKNQYIPSVSACQERLMKATLFISAKFSCLLLFAEQVMDAQ